jgi:hypothetical protein
LRRKTEVLVSVINRYLVLVSDTRGGGNGDTE